MSAVECDVPSESALDKTLIEGADFSDAYRAPLRRPEAGVIEIFFASFAHRPVDEPVTDCAEQGCRLRRP
jgi:hypothetical protein